MLTPDLLSFTNIFVVGEPLTKTPHKLGRISLDVDDTIAGVWRHVLGLHNAQSPTQYELMDIRDWNWRGTTMTTEQYYVLYNKVWHDMSHRIELLIDKKLLLKLTKHYEIDIVTSRGNVPELEATVAPLRKWLSKNGIGKFRLVISDELSTKDVLGYDIYIDDSPVLARNISKSDKKIMFLVDHPYNRDIEESRNVKRVLDANQALIALADMAESGSKHK